LLTRRAAFIFIILRACEVARVLQAILSFVESVSPHLFSGKKKTSAFKLLQKSLAQTRAAIAQSEDGCGVRGHGD
jgi:hypothetical protein